MKYEHRIVALNSESMKEDRDKLDEVGAQGFKFAGIVQAYVDAKGFTRCPLVILEREIGSAPIANPLPEAGR